MTLSRLMTWALFGAVVGFIYTWIDPSDRNGGLKDLGLWFELGQFIGGIAAGAVMFGVPAAIYKMVRGG